MKTNLKEYNPNCERMSLPCAKAKAGSLLTQ